MINFYCQPTKTNEIRGKRQVAINLDPNHKRSATVMLTCSNLGNKKAAHIVFNKKTAKRDNNNELGKQIESALTIPNNIRVHSTPSGWMNRYVLTKWHSDVFKDDGRRLFIDRAGAHYTEYFTSSLSDKQKENMLYIPAGCTDELQPLDVSVNKLFKDYYRHYLEINAMPQLASKAQSERQHIINAVSYSWNKIPINVIITGFIKSGISRQ